MTRGKHPQVKYIHAAFSAAGQLRLQPYAGSAWRGAFGHALKKTVCIAGMRPCPGCHVRHVCLFPKLFPYGPLAEDDVPARFATPPVPFVLTVDPTPRVGFFEPHERIGVRLLLLDDAAERAPYVLYALIEAMQRGIGSERVPLHLAGIGRVGGPLLMPDGDGFAAALSPFSLRPPPLPDFLRLKFVTPLRLRLANDLVTGEGFQPSHLISAALRRTYLLLGRPTEETARRIRMAGRDLSWQNARFGWLETTRRSSRQESLMRFGGIVGEADLDLGGMPEDIKELIWLASILHVGKGASMGFGRIVLEGI